MSQFKSVPRKPSKAMVSAGMAIGDDNCLYWKHPQQAYVDMLQATPEIDERAHFEAFYLVEYYEGNRECGLEWLSSEPCGRYRYAEPARQWKAWQARAKL